MKTILLLSVLVLLNACSSGEKTPAQKLEEAGREQGRAMAEELKKPLDKAKAVEQQVLDAAKAQQDAINAQISTETNSAPDAEPTTEQP